MTRKEVLAKISDIVGTGSLHGKRIHGLIKASAPGLSPKTWYEMPAYANEDGKDVCFFTAASKFKERYATFGFNVRLTSTEAPCGRPPSR